MISIVENFNKISLHEPEKYPEVMERYNHIPEIKEIDNRGYEIHRPLFSHSSIPNHISSKEVKKVDFDFKSNFLYCVLLHHNNLLAIKNLNCIPSDILEYVREKKCRLILDNLLEGHSVVKLIPLLYKSINELKLPPDQIYYITNNLLAENQHSKWCRDNNIYKKVNILSFMYNVLDVKNLQNRNLYNNPIIKSDNYRVQSPYKHKALPAVIDIEKEISYKENNLKNIKHFLKINRTNREERNLFMLFLNKEDILKKSLVSFPDFPEEYIYPDYFEKYTDSKNIENLLVKLPFDIDESDRANHGPAGFGLNEFDADLPFNPVHYRNTFISIVMCAFPFENNACHLHSSTFNPLYCGHPIIQFGPYKHLEELKKRGFKTFNQWWDESYDNIKDPWKRLNSIFKLVKTLSKLSPSDLIEIYKSMKEVLQHNSDLIQNYNGKNKLIKFINE